MRFKGPAALTAAALLCLFAACGCDSSPSTGIQWKQAGGIEAVAKELRQSPEVPRRDGVAAAILLDTSGSMKDPVTGLDGLPVPKIQVAQKALLNLLKQFVSFAREHTEEPVLVGIYEFSAREGEPGCRRVVELGPPDMTKAHAIARLTPEGPTPIGDAMAVAKRDLDATGMSKRHILVITDGESNVGYAPRDVVKVIRSLPEEDQAGVYFIAFDVEAELFSSVKDAGALLLTADDEKELEEAIDSVLSGNILDWKPKPHDPRGHPLPGIIPR